MVSLRRQIALNAGCANYREYRWRDMLRFDYTPADCETFHAAIEEAVAPAAQRIYARAKQRLVWTACGHGTASLIAIRFTCPRCSHSRTSLN
jgi:oligoendopeptidase F